jgi:low temperature requirement protein LtrA
VGDRGGHLAERYELFIILALGESILVTGTTYGGLPRSGAVVAAFVAFIGSVALWWLYFDRGAEAGWKPLTHPVDSTSSNCYTGPSARTARLRSGIST